jgi:hypothetical protein
MELKKREICGKQSTFSVTSSSHGDPHPSPFFCRFFHRQIYLGVN